MAGPLRIVVYVKVRKAIGTDSKTAAAIRFGHANRINFSRYFLIHLATRGWAESIVALLAGPSPPECRFHLILEFRPRASYEKMADAYDAFLKGSQSFKPEPFSSLLGPLTALNGRQMEYLASRGLLDSHPSKKLEYVHLDLN